PDDLALHLRRNAEHGWINLILAAPDAAAADRRLGAAPEALRRLLDRDMTLQEALEVQRLAAGLAALRADLRRTVVLRRAAALAAPEEREPEHEGDEPEDAGPSCLLAPSPAAPWWSAAQRRRPA